LKKVTATPNLITVWSSAGGSVSTAPTVRVK
jgi:hypothetical protein